jgi:hypothetical protein
MKGVIVLDNEKTLKEPMLKKVMNYKIQIIFVIFILIIGISLIINQKKIPDLESEEIIGGLSLKEWEAISHNYLEHITKTPIMTSIQISESETIYAVSNGKGELIAELNSGFSGIYKNDYTIVIPSIDKVNVLTDVSPLQQIELYLQNNDLISTNCYYKDGFIFYEMNITGEESIRELYQGIPNFSDELIGKYMNMLNSVYQEEAADNLIDTGTITESIKVINSLDNSSIIVTNDVAIGDKFINIFAISYAIEVGDWQLQEEWYNDEISTEKANNLIEELQINLSSIINESVNKITQETED